MSQRTSVSALLLLLGSLLIPAALPAQAPATPATPAPPPAAAPTLPTVLANPGFEEGEVGQAPAGWLVSDSGRENGYSAALVADKPESGSRSVLLMRQGERKDPRAFGNVFQTLDAAPYRGKRVRFRAAVRTEMEPGGQAGLWLRVDRQGGQRGAFDNMGDRPIRRPEWAPYEIVAEVANDATTLNVGAMLQGDGKAWVDSAVLEVTGEAGTGNEPARPLSGRGLDNLVAFTRLLGYVRFFHPSDQVAQTFNWPRLTLAGVQAAEGAKDAQDLATRLEAFFRPVAPTLRVFPTGGSPAPADFGTPSPKIVAWRHYGVGISSRQSIYWSKRMDNQEPSLAGRGEPTVRLDLEKPEQVFQADLGGGVSARIPLTLYADAKGTLPAVGPDVPPPAPSKPDGFVLSGNDRATRLAEVALVWNVFQHFYPYFDVVQTDWPGALRRSLESAATDSGEEAFLTTLERLLADLHDGHASVGGPGSVYSHSLPLTWDWIEEQLVVTYADPAKAAGIERGSTVLRIDGKPVPEVLASYERRISSPTPQWRRNLALRRMRAGAAGGKVTLDLRSPAGAASTVTLERTVPNSGAGSVSEPLPEKIAEVRPGIFYVDLSRISDDDFKGAVEKLAGAQGIVFDLRGYPMLSTAVLAHLIDAPVNSPWWNVPVTTRPDREGVTFDPSNWEVKPAAPRLRAKAAFLTGGGAISYAETYMAIVEAYKLAEIVGGPTAGTNGNINPFNLPGGYLINWTGMKVLKQDGSQQHGVGIRPTVPVSRTLQGVVAGKDEVLEKGIGVVSRQDPGKIAGR